MKRITLLLIPIFLIARDYSSYVIPAFATTNTGVERMWNGYGVSGGLIVNSHRFGGELYYLNHDEAIPGSTLNNNLHLWGTAYLHWGYQFSLLNRIVLIAPGISLGYQYAEVDRNWDSTFAGSIIYEGDTISSSTPLNWESESKVQSFGGPECSVALGWKFVYFNTRFRLNVGKVKQWGGFHANDPAVTGIDAGSGITIGDVNVAEAGWQSSSSGLLQTGLFFLPEWQFGLLILF